MKGAAGYRARSEHSQGSAGGPRSSYGEGDYFGSESVEHLDSYNYAESGEGNTS